MADTPTRAERTATTKAERITNLDTVRGVATLGILVMNVVSFGLSSAAYVNIDAQGSGNGLDRTIGYLGEIFADQKMMGLFSLLFGAGIVVFADRAEAKGLRPVRLSLWRNTLLLLIGLAHTLLWDGDVLILYALCSPVLLLARKWNPRLLLAIGGGLMVASALVAFAAQSSVGAEGQGLGELWFVDGGDPADGPGGFLLFDAFARALGMMLIGVGLFRLDVVQGRMPVAFYRRMAIVGLGVGTVLAVASVAWRLAADDAFDVALTSWGVNTLATVPMVLGYLGVITLFNQRLLTAAHVRLRAVGQMALTNYLTQTIISITVLRVILDQGTLGRAQLLLFVVIVWLVQLLWSPWWLERFRFGPFEWLWRCATYRQWQPLRRT